LITDKTTLICKSNYSKIKICLSSCQDSDICQVGITMKEKPEQKLVEDYAAERLQGLGWKFVPAPDLQRESISEPLLIENLKTAILKINKDLNLGEEELKKVVDELKLLTSGQEGVKQFLYYLKYGIPIYFRKERINKRVGLFDFENPKNNEFIFSRQVHFRGKELIIPDIVLYVNGIPLVDIECKNPASLKTGWEEGFRQIKEYEKIAPEVYKYIQIGVAFAEKVRYFPIVPWRENIATYVWQKDNLPEDEAIFEFLTPQVLLDILRNFLFIREEYGEVQKVIARYMQYRAANKIYKRVIDNLTGNTDKNKGLIWHWQGSGKTLTMIFASHKLYFERLLEKPTIFFIVDRRDLVKQMNDELSSLRLGFSFEKIETVAKLKEIISYDDFRGKRGVFLTLIHKFDPKEKFVFGSDGIRQRKNIICFLDEVHRTEYGLLAAQMKRVLENAFFFGFTGTPISEDERRNTYQAFAYPIKEEAYLDRYFINESQKDGFTIPIVYQPRLEKRVHMDKEKILWFLEQFQDEEINPEQKEKINKAVEKQLSYITVFLENENRIKEIAKDIASHFQKNVDGKFKAMVVTGSRKACVLYKKHLDQYLPTEYSEVVMTFNQNDKEPIRSFYEDWRKRHKGFFDDNDRIKNIVETFKEKVESNPKILIVTDMLITGFDAPLLQTMYLDKFLKKHRLLQAIARVNRPYQDVKPAGLVVDYVGILKNIDFALKQYYKEEIEGGIADFDVLWKTFEEKIKILEKIFAGIRFRIERKNLLAALDRLREEETKNRFVENYKTARKIFEMLGAGPKKINWLEKFSWFSAVFEYWTKLTQDEGEIKQIAQKYFQKTIEIIHQSTEIKEFEKSLPPFSFDYQYLEKLQRSSLSQEEKAPALIFALEKLILVHQRNNPVYKTIIDQLEDLIKKWQERRINYQELFNAEGEIIKFLQKQEKERKGFNLSPFEFGMLSLLEEKLKTAKNKLSKYVKNILALIEEDLIENWRENPILKQNIARKTRTYLLDLKREYGLSYEEFDALHKELISFINDYAK